MMPYQRRGFFFDQRTLEKIKSQVLVGDYLLSRGLLGGTGQWGL
jgi:hypothetical protein